MTWRLFGQRREIWHSQGDVDACGPWKDGMSCVLCSACSPCLRPRQGATGRGHGRLFAEWPGPLKAAHSGVTVPGYELLNFQRSKNDYRWCREE